MFTTAGEGIEIQHGHCNQTTFTSAELTPQGETSLKVRFDKMVLQSIIEHSKPKPITTILPEDIIYPVIFNLHNNYKNNFTTNFYTVDEFGTEDYDIALNVHLST